MPSFSKRHRKRGIENVVFLHTLIFLSVKNAPDFRVAVLYRQMLYFFYE